jgi:hypothetical protein
MSAPAHSPFHKELSGLAFFISLPQLIASPIVVGLQHLMVVIIQRGQFNLFSLLIAVAGAALLSNLLHAIFEEIPSVDVKNSFSETFLNPANSGSGNLLLVWIDKIFGIYWKTFGPILSIQSCCIGIYAGDNF